MSVRTKRLTAGSSPRSFTLIELLAILAVIGLLLALLLPVLTPPKVRTKGINCVNLLKQVGLAFWIFAEDHTNLFPMAVSTNFGGAQEYMATPRTFRFFQAMSNELSTPRVVLCQTDTRRSATDFGLGFSNSNVRYFVGLDADGTQPHMFLAGDRNLTSSIRRTNWILELRPGATAGWTRAMHRFSGNAALADGSVQQFSGARLQHQVASVTNASQRLALPE
ncbi:MAG: type II secretion system protein [Pedosphaera parvula]|nr:type II secretion system protein [Pedosphaera parvula]